MTTPIADRDHHVYEIYSVASGACIYVGMTCNLARRLGEHRSRRQWRAPQFRVVARAVHGRAAAEALEAERIAALAPLQNRYTNHGPTVPRRLEDA